MKRTFVLLLIVIAGFLAFTHMQHLLAEDRREGNDASFIWPISGSDGIPDLPQSSTYGPRLKASENFRYDYHQGIDIPTPIGTTLLAVSSGTVRIAGSHPAYSDGVVQIDHGNNLYSNYLHVSASLVVTGQVVNMGDPVALSGASAGDNGFQHLHFEIREGSFFRRDAINPWRYLPYSDTVRHTAVITHISPQKAITIQVSTPSDELDINEITLAIRSMTDGQLLDSRVLNYETRNKAYGGDPTLLDNPDLENSIIAPHKFNSSSATYVVDVQFYNLNGFGEIEVEVCAIDVKGNPVCSTANGHFPHVLFLPVTMKP